MNGGTEKDVASRIKKANSVFVQLYPAWRNHDISKGVKIWIFSTNVKSVLLYACETCKSTNQITGRLQTFVNKWLRWIMNIKWTHNITNEELWRITKQKPIDSDKKEENGIGLDTHYVERQEQQRNGIGLDTHYVKEQEQQRKPH